MSISSAGSKLKNTFVTPMGKMSVWCCKLQSMMPRANPQSCYTTFLYKLCLALACSRVASFLEDAFLCSCYCDPCLRGLQLAIEVQVPLFEVAPLYNDLSLPFSDRSLNLVVQSEKNMRHVIPVPSVLQLWNNCFSLVFSIRFPAVRLTPRPL